MAWLSTFLLGRPGYELEFTVPPEAISIDEQPVFVLHTNLYGYKKKSVINQSMPVIRISSKYLTIGQRNSLASLAMIDDTFLSFQARDDFQVVSMKVTPSTSNQVILPPLSCLRLSEKLVEAGASSIITINSVYAVANPVAGGAYGDGGYGDGGYAGPNYSDGGSYDDLTRTITLGSALSSTDPVYVTFTYKGWLVNMDKFGCSSRGEYIDWFQYDIQLTGA